MDYEWDEAKNAANKRKHSIGFEQAIEIDWSKAIGVETQFLDGEIREIWSAPIGPDIAILVATDRGDRLRIISLRRATRHERKLWKEAIYGR